MKNLIWLGAAMFTVGCGDDLVPTVVEGDVHRYVIGEVHTPTNNAEARALALDLDFTSPVDNQFGMVLSSLATMDFDVGGTIDESVLRGNAISLIEVQALDFVDAPNAAVATHLGANPDPGACGDPLRLETCGRHLATRARYDVRDGGDSDVGYTSFTDGVLLADLGVMPIELGLDPAAPLRVDLHAARIKLLGMTPDGGTAILAGGFTSADVRDVIVPEIARQLTRIVETDCAQPAGTGACACTGRGLAIQKYFDADDSCDLTLAEVRSNTITQSLLAPDLRIDGEQLLSIGFAATLVPATFESEPLR